MVYINKILYICREQKINIDENLVMIGDGDQIGAVIAIALLLASYVSEKKLLKTKKSLS